MQCGDELEPLPSLVQAVQSAEQHTERTHVGLLGGYREVSVSDHKVTVEEGGCKNKAVCAANRQCSR